MKLPLRFMQFALVGAIGFAVDASVLQLLTAVAGWDPLQARAVSFLCAVTVTWLINRRYTFADKRTQQQRLSSEYSRYLLAQGSGAALNYAVFAMAILLVPLMKHYPVLALVLGSAVAMLFNYFAMQRWVFSRSPR